jgi:outer membrane biosynthesis protein TonB
MTMTLELKTDIDIPYLDTEDAFEIFETVVQNGQTRLALEVLVDIMVSLLNKVNELDETVSEIVSFLSDDSEPEAQAKEEIKQQEPVKEEAPKPEATVKVKTKKEDTEIKE